MKLTANEVCYLAGISIYTLNNWYKFKELCPDDELAKRLPECEYVGVRKRYWDESDVGKIIEFKASLPRGRGGRMASATQRYTRKYKERMQSK